MLLLLATLWPATAIAQDELLDEEQAEIRLYTVEIIVFTYSDNVSAGSEIFVPDAAEVAVSEPELASEIDVPASQRRHPDFIGLKPQRLAADQFTLQKVFEQLELLDAYDPILHAGWTQPGYPQNDTIAMRVSDLQAPPAGLDGSFTLYLGRYLHLIVDLALTPPAEVAEYADEFGTLREFEYALPPLEGPVRFRIQEDRIIKNGEIRYFDHPKFGVVAKVLRVESGPEQTFQEFAR
jgi:hypothetical protein